MDLWDESTDNSTFSSLQEDHTSEQNYQEEYDGDNAEDSLQGLPDALLRYDKFHYSIHGYLALTIIVVGTIGNIVTAVVLTRKAMTSPINTILAALAVADAAVLVTYLVKVRFHSDLQFMSYTELTYSMAVFSMYFSHFFVLSHTASVWLTVVAALWRVMAVRCPGSTVQWRTPRRAKVAIACTAAACALVCVPEFLKMKVEVIADDGDGVSYNHAGSDLYLRHQRFFDAFDNWVFNWLLYLLPCVPLTAFTVVLATDALKGRKEKHRENDPLTKNDSADKRLSAVLIFILVVFLVVRIPPGIMYTLEFALHSRFIHQVHYVFSGTINVLILFNSSINFFIYFGLSPRFRDTAYEVFCPNLAGKLRRSKHQKLESEMELNRY